MSRFIVAISAAAFLTACDSSNPFQDAELEVDVEEEATVEDDGTIFATELNEDLTGNAFAYDDQGTADPSDDTLLVNNVPFDNSDLTGGGYTRSTTTLPNAFDVYESNSGTSGSRQYFAVFQRAEYSEVAAIATGDYVAFGFGAATAQQLTDDNGIPAERPEFYTFTGDYAAVRVTTADGGEDDIEFITGDANLQVDILDFDVDGAVEGTIVNRDVYDVDGAFVTTLNDFVSLATADIDFSTGDIGSSTASSFEVVVDPDTGEPSLEEVTTGEWQGFFAGPNGEEIAGFVVLEGDTTAAEAEDVVRETGVFIVENTE